MRVAIGCDHGGYPLRQAVIEAVREAGCEPLDFGAHGPERSDYPDHAEKVGRAIQKGEAERGVLICGSGVGISIAANKMKGVYAAVCHDTYSAHQGVEHDQMNVLCLGGLVIGAQLAKELVMAFLKAEFDGVDRHAMRVAKMKKIETEERK
jgi:ribose 5-phosphate isomerase B